MGEKRWIILGTDGGHVTVGRHSDPSPEEIDAAEVSLRKQGLAGWLAVTDGRYYGAGPIRVLAVRPLAGPRSDAWDGAVAAFMARRATSSRQGR
jgi:hypothetical protein